MYFESGDFMKTHKWYKADFGRRWMQTDAIDVLDRPIKVGNILMKPPTSLMPPEFLEVREVKNGRVYFVDNPQPLKYPGRCLIMSEQMPMIPTSMLPNHN